VSGIPSGNFQQQQHPEVSSKYYSIRRPSAQKKKYSIIISIFI
jgi:hypothetical protein